MKILCFSDFHFDSKPKAGGLNVDFDNSVADDPLASMVDLLKDRYTDNKISLIVFLGDYAKGKKTINEKKGAFKRIKSSIEKIECDCSSIFDDNSHIKNRIIILDGNHDVSREADSYSAFESIFGEYITTHTKKEGDGIRKNGAPVFDFSELNMLIACISTTENAGAHFNDKDTSELLALIKSLKSIDAEKFKKAKSLLQKKQSIDIGTVTEETIKQFKNNSKKARDVKIVFSHHPLIPMQRATATHFETVNGTKFFDIARSRGFNLFVSGHLHEFYCADIISRGKNSDLPDATIISVPTFINPDTGAQRFVELDISNERYLCRVLTVDGIRDRIEESDVATNRYYSTPTDTLENAEHILVDYEIQALIEDNNVIKNASTDRIQPASYDCALGYEYKRYDEKIGAWPDEVIKLEEQITGPAIIALAPGERVLLYTFEEFDIPKDMLLQASPRASWNRRGISVDLSFFVEPGFVGPFCFPVSNQNNHPIEINAREAIMSIVFHKLAGTAKLGWGERNPASLANRKNRLDK